jgi:mono/diheme cytochrome c family protein
MKRVSIGLVLVALSFACSAWADGASTYKTKCAMCHGADGKGKKGPALKGVALSADDIVTLLTKGDAQKKAPHTKPVSSLSADDAKALADYIKSL